MPRRKGKGTGIVSTVHSHGKRIAKLETDVAEVKDDINQLADIVVEVQEAIEPTSDGVKPAAGTKPRRPKRTPK